MRFRDSTEIQLSQTFSSIWQREGAGIGTSTLTMPISTRRQFMYDVVTEDFKLRSAKGEIFNNPKCKVEKFMNASPLYFSFKKNEYKFAKFYLALPSDPLTTDVSKINKFQYDYWKNVETSDTDAAAAYAEAVSNISLTELQLYASLGELPETVKWINSILLRMKNLLILKKRVLKKLSIDHLSDFWLEMRYAVRPLVCEMESAVGLFLKQASIPERCTARGKFDTVTRSSVSSGVLTVRGSFDICQFRYTTDKLQERSYRAGVLYDIKQDIDLLYAQLGLFEPVQSAYELIPFSFIWDWFFNIGTIIGAYAPKPFATHLSSWVTECSTFTYSRKFQNFETNVYNCATPTGGFLGGYKISRRVPWTTLPILPSIKINLDWAKTLDLALIGRNLYQTMQNVKLRS